MNCLRRLPSLVEFAGGFNMIPLCSRSIWLNETCFLSVWLSTCFPTTMSSRRISFLLNTSPIEIDDLKTGSGLCFAASVSFSSSSLWFPWLRDGFEFLNLAKRPCSDVSTASSKHFLFSLDSFYSSYGSVIPSAAGLAGETSNEALAFSKAFLSAKAMASTALAASSIFLAAVSLISAILILVLVRSISDIAFITSYLDASAIFLNCSDSKCNSWSSLEASIFFSRLVIPPGFGLEPSLPPSRHFLSPLLSSRTLSSFTRLLRDSTEDRMTARSTVILLRSSFAWFNSIRT
nr:hypothetical protein Iba_chr11eCG15100 [Ipomoea batatas]